MTPQERSAVETLCGLLADDYRSPFVEAGADSRTHDLSDMLEMLAIAGFQLKEKK